MTTTIKPGFTRVTDLLKPWQDFSGIPEEVLEAKALIGTNVHEAINLFTMGLPYQGLTEREEKYLDSYKRWEEKTCPTFLMAERRLDCEDLKLTGQIDAIIKLPGQDKGMVVDFKCSANPSPLHWPIQIGWYDILCAQNGIETNCKGMILQLNDKGKSAKEYIYQIDTTSIKNCWNV